jgi:hypothetical protein
MVAIIYGNMLIEAWDWISEHAVVMRSTYNPHTLEIRFSFTMLLAIIAA